MYSVRERDENTPVLLNGDHPRMVDP